MQSTVTIKSLRRYKRPLHSIFLSQLEMLFLLLLLMMLKRVRALVEQVAALPRPPVEETARGTATLPAVIVAGDILWYKNTEPPIDAHCKLLVQSEQETSYCYRKCKMVSEQFN